MHGERFYLPACLDLLLRTEIVALGVMAEPVGVDDQHAGSTLPPDGRELLLRSATDLDDVRALELAHRQAERREASDHVAGEVHRDRRALRPAVVLQDDP